MMGSALPDDRAAEGGTGVITEPEMEHPREPVGPDLLSSDDAPSRERRVPGRQPWLWGLGGAVVACAVGAAVLHGAGYRRDAAPDLHGYRLPSGLCTGQNLQPLTDALAARSLTVDPGVTRRGTSVDHAACSLFGTAALGGGRQTEYTVSVTVDLHRTTDPRAEFEDTVHVRAADPAPGASDYLRLAGVGAVIRPVPGLGDLAFLTTSRAEQSLSVLEGGAVVTLSVVAENQWEASAGAPTPPDGSPSRLPLADTTDLRAVLPGTVRHLMSVLAR
ncbi:hypothetical protein V2S66_18240 [Streptomyces sp. V4-01]|uniref:DUF5642 domain-containing protein n=1 Tax=Actinacidiphila polyblastidii TaxID=3110430 RepID=A0ABU7PDM3_9ACTN|nr:hypothetical protein [Streptomyces sp. V4-01]